MSSTLNEHWPARTNRTRLLILGAVMAALGFAFGRYGLRAFEPIALGWEDGLAVALGLMFLGFAAVTAIVSMRGRSPLPQGMSRLHVLVFGTAGLMFLAPVLAPASLDPRLVFAGMVAVFAAQTWVNAIAWRRSDEMMRRIMCETSTIAFWGLQGAFFLYAAAERLGLITPISAWGLTGILMAVYLISSIVPSVRRGLT